MSRSKSPRFSLMICINPSAGPILVVGGGTTGLRKIRTLLGAGMDVTLVSPDALPEVEELAQAGLIDWRRRRAKQCDFEEHNFALLALPRMETESVLSLAEGTRCHLNCCGAPELGMWSLAAQFHVRDASPVAVSDREEASADQDISLVVGVGSGGRSPFESATLKRKLQEYLEGERP